MDKKLTRMSTLSRSKSTKSMKEILLETRKNVPLHKCTFDQKKRGWIGPVKSQPQATSRWAKARGAVWFMGLRPHEKRTIDVESLVKATKRLRSFSAKDQHKTMQFVGDTDGISNEESVLDKPLIVKPFQSRSPADWTAPRSLKPVKERSKEFTFEKPKLGENEKLPSARSNLQAEYLKKLLGEKEKEINMLHNQLHKANNENVKLIQELEGYRGKNYDEIYQENLTYKENLNRVCKENVILRGQLRQEANKKLQKLKEFERPRTCVNMVRSQHERIRLVQSAKPRSSIISNIN